MVPQRTGQEGKRIVLHILYTEEKIPYGLPVFTQAAWDNNDYADVRWEQETRNVTMETTLEYLVTAFYRDEVLSHDKKYLRRSRIYFVRKTQQKPRQLRLQDDENGNPGEDRGKTLGELGLTSNSFLVVYAPQPPQRPVYYNPGSIVCMYGCPVTDRNGNTIYNVSEMTEAEIYQTGQSIVSNQKL